MKITIENYEAYLLDKTEGTLSQQDSEILEQFFVLHPDLKAKADLYDPSLVLEPDYDMVYEDKEALKRKSPVVIYWKRYTAIAVPIAAMFVLGIFIFNINDEKPAIQQAIAIATKPDDVKQNKNNVITAAKPAIKKLIQSVNTIKSTPATTEPINMVTEEKDSVIYVDNLVVYEVDNLVEYMEEVDNLVVYEVDNLIEYNKANKLTFFEQERRRLNTIITTGKETYNFIYAKVMEEKQRFFNI